MTANHQSDLDTDKAVENPPKPVNDKEPNPQEPNWSNVQALLPGDIQAILNKELALLNRDRPKVLDLLKKEIAAEQKFLKEWGFPTACTYTGCTPEKISDAKSWLKKVQCDLEEQKAGLLSKKETVQGKITEREQKIAQLENDLNTLLKSLKGLPAEIKAAQEQVVQLTTAHQAAAGTPIHEIILAELTAAKEKLNWLCGSPDPQAACTPKFENTLHRAIDGTLKAWRQAKSDLRILVVGDSTTPTPPDSLEGLEAALKDIDKKLEYLKTYWDVLIAKYLKDCGKCNEVNSTSAA